MKALTKQRLLIAFILILVIPTIIYFGWWLPEKTSITNNPSSLGLSLIQLISLTFVAGMLSLVSILIGIGQIESIFSDRRMEKFWADVYKEYPVKKVLKNKKSKKQ